jgi:hypothetical protein
VPKKEDRATRQALDDSSDERRHSLSDAGRATVRWIGYAIPSVIVPLILGYSIKDSAGVPVLDNYDQMVVGAMLFIIFTLAGITQKLTILARGADQRRRAFRIERNLDGRLNNIRDSYETLLKRREYQENLYAKLFDIAIADLENTIHRTATNHTMFVDHYTYKASQHTTDIIALRNRDILRFVHYFGDDFLSTVQGQDFYKRISGMCCNGNVQLRRLCVYTTDDQLIGPDATRLFDFHSRNKNHAARTINLATWTSMLEDADVREHGDMGVWGEILCYRSPKHNAGNAEGVYSSDAQTIAQLRDAFDRAWEFGDIASSATGGPMTVHELVTGNPPPDSIRDRELAVVGGKTRKLGR